MKKLFFILIIASISISLTAVSGQFTLQVTADEDDGMVNRFASYISAEAAGWDFINSTFVKYSEFQDDIADYYQENRAVNLLHASRISNNWTINIMLGFAGSFGDNHLTEMSGSENLFDYQNSLNLGGSAIFDDHKYHFKLQTEYISGSFLQYTQDETQLEDISETDLLYSAAAGYYLRPELLISANYDKFEDLNESDSFDYADYYLLAEYSKRLNYIHHLQQEVQMGYSDLMDDMNQYLQTRTRFSSKFAMDWTLLNIFAWQGWMQEDENEIYLGNSWYETSIRRNISISEDNQLSFVQAGMVYEFDKEVLSADISGRYYFNDIKIYSANRWYAGSSRWQDHELLFGCGWEFLTEYTSIAYEYELDKAADAEDTNSHRINIQYTF